jgi:hypothetical protein
MVLRRNGQSSFKPLERQSLGNAGESLIFRNIEALTTAFSITSKCGFTDEYLIGPEELGTVVHPLGWRNLDDYISSEMSR